MGVRPAARIGLAPGASVSRARPITGRLSPGALGLALVLLVSAAWGTGVFYLLARLGLSSPVRLASMDGIHVYVGLVGGVFVLAKVSRVGFRHRVDGVPGVIPWHRWMSWSMLVLYGAVFITGVLVLLPIPGRVFNDLVEMHLLASVWALLPTTWHVWHYRALALPFLSRWRGRATLSRYWIGFALVLLPVPLLLASAPAVSQLPEVMGGSAWSPTGLGSDSYLNAIAANPDGSALLAAGDALYVSRDGGVVWVRIDLPLESRSAANRQPPASGADQHAGHQHGTPAPANPITALAVTPSTVFVGTPHGLYSSAGLNGPLTAVAFPGGGVRALAVDPAEPGSMWVASVGGPMFTVDGGHSWQGEASGLGKPSDVAAIAYLDRDVFVSDGTGVFRWLAGSRAWLRTSTQSAVIDLTAGSGDPALYASSLNNDLQVLADDRWTDLGAPAPMHYHHGHVHGGQLGGVTEVASRLYIAGTSEGVSASADGGRTWTQLGGGLSSVTSTQVIAYRGSLWVATSNGLYRYALTSAPAATRTWWLVVIGSAAGIGVLAASISGLSQRRWRKRPSGHR